MQAANNLRALLTFCAARAILAQLEGSGRGDLSAFNHDQFLSIRDLLVEMPMRDGDEWLAELSRRNKLAAVRVMEVRQAYATTDFEWDNVKSIALRDIREGNLRLMRQSVMSLEVAGDEDSGNSTGTRPES